MRIRLATILCLAALWSSWAGAQSTPCKSTATGDLRLHPFESKIFGNTRTLRVWLPPGYDSAANPDKRYPVLYMLDGQNLFDACLSEVSHKEWGLDETVARLIREKTIPELIVVGVDHAGAKRAYEYLPYRDYAGNSDMEEPAGKQFPDFLAREVVPFVNDHYRTLTGHPNTGLGGSSYGGVATLYALMAQPNLFGYALIESPTMWVGMGQLVRDTSPLIARPRKVFIAFGGKEGGTQEGTDLMVKLIRTVQSNFAAEGYDEKTFRFVLEPEAKHEEPAWAQRLPGALEFLFRDWKPQPETPPQ
jgi:predicted alpha/beta superfamily hydrolase